MIRFLFRLLSMVALAIAGTMAVIDATRSVAASALVTTPLGQSWRAALPDTLDEARAAVEDHLLPMLWDPVMTSVLALPGFAVFAALALILYAMGHRPRRRGTRLATGR